MSKSYALAEIAKWAGGAVRGHASTRISGVAGLDEADSSQISWLADEKYAPQLTTSKAGAVVVPTHYGATPMPAILCDNPSLAIATILEKFAPPVPRPAPGVHPQACVSASARLGRDVAVGPFVVIGDESVVGDRTVLHAHTYIGPEVRIGNDCELWPCVVVRERCRLGNRVVVHPNCTIGADGFGYQFVGGRHAKIPQIGSVEIEDDVEIGANSTIDRAKFGATRIGRGTKIDNLVQVAHNVRIGPNCMIVAQCGIAGSTRLGQGVVLGGKAGLRDHISLGDGVQIAGCACVSKDVPAGKTMIGSPAVDHEQFIRERAKVRRLPEMADQLRALIKRVEQLEASTDHQ